MDPGTQPAPEASLQPTPQKPGGFFSTAQVERGRATFLSSCKECHAISEFRGSDFEWRWRRQSAWNLFREISSNMPENKPGSLPPETYADIVAYLLSVNEYPTGGDELAATREAMDAVPLGAGADKTKPSA